LLPGWQAALAAIVLVTGSVAAAAAAPQKLDGERALAASQAAVGRLVGDHAFTDTRYRGVRLADFRGRPLIVNMVYTGCADICPTISESLARAVDVAREALDNDSFHVITVGFDTRSDTPDRMRSYARSHGLDGAGWDFLSGTGDAAGRLADELGFLYFAAPQGFDHTAQVTIIDADGRIYRQIYGATFEPPALVEPLKDLIWGRSTGLAGAAALLDRIKLVCTVYDAASGRYRFSYAIFISIGLSGLTLCAIGFVIARAWLRSRRSGASLTPARQ
jgi:protein SCO1/2